MISARWFIALLLVTLALAWAFAWKAMAQGDVPIAAFACNEGLCVVPHDQVDRMMRVWYWMQQRVNECPRAGQES